MVKLSIIWVGLNRPILWVIQPTKVDLQLLAEKNKQNKMKYDSYIGATTLGIDIENKAVNLEGKIEGDFSNDGDVFGLTYAYVQHNFDNDLFVLIGKTDQIGEENTLSNNDNAVAGFNGTDQVVQIRLGGSFDLGSITLTPEIALEDIKDILIGEDETNYVNRTAFPGIGVKYQSILRQVLETL